MVHKNYDSELFVQEALVDVSFIPDEQQDFSEVLTIWSGYFNFIMSLIPLNDEGMWEGLTLHYHVDMPWREKLDEPWEIDNLELTLKQLQYAQKQIRDMEQTSSSGWDIPLVSDICADICEIIKKAANGQGKAFITYYY